MDRVNDILFAGEPYARCVYEFLESNVMYDVVNPINDPKSILNWLLVCNVKDRNEELFFMAMQNLKELRMFRRDISKGQIYIGPTRLNNYHGDGVLAWDTNVYRGPFHWGKRQGHGNQIQRWEADGYVFRSTFVGQFNDDKFSKGINVIKVNNIVDSIYTGTWQNTKRDKGNYKYRCDKTKWRTFDGIFEDNEFKHGKLKYDEHTHYIGDFSGRKRHGKGILCDREVGEKYEGEWQNNLRHGKGIQTWDDGHRYDGFWKKDQQHGQGIHTTPLKVYSGMFRDGWYHGMGTMNYKNNNSYVGQFKKGSYEGMGKFTWANGDSYTGPFKYGASHGKGIFVAKETGVKTVPSSKSRFVVEAGSYEGEWERAPPPSKEWKKIGTFTCTYFDTGNKYVGTLRPDTLKYIRSGKGTMIYADGTSYDGQWRDDKRCGVGTMTYTDGTVYDGDWWNDLRHGHGQMRRPDGSIVYKGPWKNNFKRSRLKRTRDGSWKRA